MSTLKEKLLNLSKCILYIDIKKRIVAYLLIVTSLSIIFSAYQPPETYFSQTNNVLNQVFAKRAWMWNLMLLVPFICITSWEKPDRKKLVIVQFSRLVAATVCWYICTNTFDLILTWFGHCDEEDLPRKVCIRSGNIWEGYDISGHCFILIYSSLILSSEAQLFKAKNFQNQTYKIKTYLFMAVALLQTLWDLSLVCTSIYFHTVSEKVFGASFAVASWFLTYEYVTKHVQMYLDKKLS